MVGNHSRLMKTQIWTVGDVGDGFRSLRIPQTAGLQSPYDASFNFWRTFHFRPNSSGDCQRQNCGDYPIYLGRSAKSKIPDRLGFSWHQKTRLYLIYLGRSAKSKIPNRVGFSRHMKLDQALKMLSDKSDNKTSTLKNCFQNFFQSKRVIVE